MLDRFLYLLDDLAWVKVSINLHQMDMSHALVCLNDAETKTAVIGVALHFKA
jgi:hypothetical protein